MNSRRIITATAIALAVALAAVLTWQLLRDDGSYDAGDRDRFTAYCDEVEAQQEGLGEVLAEGGRGTGLLDALPAFRELSAKAPSDIADDWSIVVSRIEALDSALTEAGVDPATYDRDDPPAGVDEDAQRRIDRAATALAAPESQAALNRVSQHSRDVCHTPLHF